MLENKELRLLYEFRLFLRKLCIPSYDDSLESSKRCDKKIRELTERIERCRR